MMLIILLCAHTINIRLLMLHISIIMIEFSASENKSNIHRDFGSCNGLQFAGRMNTQKTSKQISGRKARWRRRRTQHTTDTTTQTHLDLHRDALQGQLQPRAVTHLDAF